MDPIIHYYDTIWTESMDPMGIPAERRNRILRGGEQYRF